MSNYFMGELIYNYGFWTMAAVKFAVYSCFLYWVVDRHSVQKTMLASGTRVALGTLLGLAVISASIHGLITTTAGSYILLTIGRIGIWLLILKLFYKVESKQKLIIYVAIATLISTLADVPALAGWVLWNGVVC